MSSNSSFDGFSVPPLWSGGPSPSGYYNFPSKTAPASASKPITHSQAPITTGSSVFAIKYKDGVIIATDTMGSYGSLARFPDLKRVIAVNKTTIVGFTGDIADFQFLQEQMERKQREEDAVGGGITMKPKALHCWLTRFLIVVDFCCTVNASFKMKQFSVSN
jgi:20S proteasome subunit beta 7